MKREKKLIKIANEIVELEKQMALGKNVKTCESKIMEMSDSLSLEEMLFVDNYIMEKKLLSH